MSVLEFGEGKQQLETTLLVSNASDGALSCRLYEGETSIEPGAVLVSSFKTWLATPGESRGFLTADNQVVRISGEEACEAFFKLLFNRLSQQGRELTAATRFVIAEPAYGSTERSAYQAAIRKAVAAAAGREVTVDFFREPDAVFSYFRTTPGAIQLEASQNVLVVDAGGGTCNLSVVTLTAEGELWERRLAVPVSADAPLAGGSTVDKSIIHRALSDSPYKAALLSKDPAVVTARDRWVQSQLRSTERLKVEASLKGKATARLKLDPSFGGRPGDFIKVALDAGKLKAEARTLWNAKRIGSELTQVLKSLRERLSKTAQRKGLDPDPRKLINLIILTGGTSRLPGFRDCLDDFFKGLGIPVQQLMEDASLAVVRGLRQSYIDLSELADSGGGGPSAQSKTVFLPALDEDLALYWLTDGGGRKAGLVYETQHGPYPYLYGQVPDLRAPIPAPHSTKVKKKGPVQYQGQVCPVSDVHATDAVPSPNRLNMLSDRVQLSPDLHEVGVRTRLSLEDGHVPQLVLDFREGEKVVESWSLPYLDPRRDGAGEEEGDDVLFIDFGTSATRVGDMRTERQAHGRSPAAHNQQAAAAAPSADSQTRTFPEFRQLVPLMKTQLPQGQPPQAQPPQAQPPQAPPPQAPPPQAPPPQAQPPQAQPRFLHRERMGFNGDEKDFVAYLEEYCRNTGLVVEDGLIKNLYLCTKVRPLVVLAGPPGVGKSSVASRFAEAMGSSFEPGHDSVRIAVEANWTDGRYLFWQHHSLGVQDPSRFHQLLRHLESSHAERPHHVLLDEMNLAHVEYYFAQFLSAFEADGVVTVPGARLEHAELRLPHRTRPSELAFFGTINIDETTHVLSDKVLDRCNLIEVRMSSIPTQYSESRPKKELGITVKQLRAWRDVPEGAELVSPGLRSIVMALATETPPSDPGASRTHGRGIHLGYRLVRDIGLFCYFAGQLGVDPKSALDWQVCQRILPRIRGDARLSYALRQLDAELTRQELPKSRERLQRLMRDLDDGFVSFWS